MSKVRQIFACRQCGAVQTKWMGKCPDCGTWESLEAQRVEPKAKVDPRASSMAAWSAEAASDQDGPDGLLPGPLEPPAARSPARPIGEVDTRVSQRRIETGVSELDRVLGGGLVPGSAVLVGGDPGIGKSTLLLQAAHALAQRGHRTLYVSSEESAEQVKLRFARLGGPRPAPEAPKPRATRSPAGTDGTSAPPERPASDPPDLFLLAETSLSRIVEQAARVLNDAPENRPPVLIVDSVQMIYKADLDAFPGSLTQLRRCCAELVYLAKASGTTVILVGHVTKDGQLAGPRLLEHLVDAVLYFEGDRYHAHRLVRAVKNRFGTTLELGLLEMSDAGLRPAEHAAAMAAAQRSAVGPGTVVCPVMTGSRCLLVELQALTATGFLGAAKRKSSGLDASRLSMLIAVLEQHAGLRLADRDVFASVVGGLRIAEPAADLALLLAIAGAHFKRGLPPACVAVGEVGLAGEVRPASQMDQRLLEAARLGFTAALIPASSAKAAARSGLELIPVRTVNQAIEHLA